ncbi:atypical CYS HIS rich thioredoxin 5 [Actinidia rufa]|uniref:Atypical CYS HIS rich thioredoxin 5 n=1 Tax=Actinidia rufa TaxID=165716 RepID=A0A7J0GAB2_9ERIC|nr:atypical CYS HIS rich thioredoxin 5 [Actinidia rufa]
MACSLKTGLSVSGSNQAILGPKSKGVLRNYPIHSLQFTESHSKDFWGKPNLVEDHKVWRDCNPKAPANFSIKAQSSICVSQAMRWWEKTLKPNMKEINSSQELVDSLLIAGDRLAIVDFYSPGCGGCKALHPKIKKFKDALAKHGTERCHLGPAKGLDESELLSLASIGEISTINMPLSTTREAKMEDLVLKDIDLYRKMGMEQEKSAILMA